ncbi:hypothetical protein ACN4EG_20765 [Alkalinema pantanalense CENA528]|uniref:hypothetical protein n=1 Tax=Alkalinema pantanalense TaxID=1620705 RepID=UPI003D6FDC2B
MDLNSLLAVLTFLGGGIAGISGTLWGMAQWYAKAKNKEYAAQRDFAHLKRNQEQQAENMRQIMEEVELLNRAVIRLETLITSFFERKSAPS